MSPIRIKYVFRWPDAVEDSYDLVLDGSTLDIISPLPGEIPQWAMLDFNKCPSCPLDAESSPYCPLALALVSLNTRFAHRASYEKVHVTVVMAERTAAKETTVQQAVSSLMGLISPCSGCPHTHFFKPMARFHQPFATEQETIYRASSMYMLAQYFLKIEGMEADHELAGLNDIYRSLQEVNAHCAMRLRHGASNDSAVNAVVLLDMFAKSLPYAIKESLEELGYLFHPFLRKPNLCITQANASSSSSIHDAKV